MSIEIEKPEPCPFCNADSDRIILTEHEAHTHSAPLKAMGIPDHPGSWTIECGGCPAGMIESTRAEVVSAWNRRATQPAPIPAQTAGAESLDEKALNALLWFYRRAHHAYGRLPFAEEAITGLRARLATPAEPPAGNALTEEAKDAARLDFMAEHEAWIGWSKDGESCRVFHRDEDGDVLPMLGWGARHWRNSAREAIDAVIASHIKAGQAGREGS